MSARDGRSVGELLLHADTAARDLLFDVTGEDAPAMLRTWGEVVQNAAELWQALPARPRGGTAGGQLMVQLEAITQRMHRTQLRQGWPGAGDPDERLLSVAESFGAARDLVRAHAGAPGQARSLAAMRDAHAARTRTMHALYVAAHAVSIAVREHVQHLREMPRVDKQWARTTRGIPRGTEALERLTAFEQLAGSYLSDRFVGSLRAEHRDGYAGLGRLCDAITRWDLQAHRTIAANSTPANLATIARTTAVINRTSLILVRAAAHTGTADPVTYEQQIAPAFEEAIRAQSHMARLWGSLTNAMPRKVDPKLWAAAEQLQAATRELIHDKTALADPTLIAERADLRDLAPVVKVATVAGFTLASDVREIATHHTGLSAPARAMLDFARNAEHARGPGDEDVLGESLSPTDLQHNRVRPLIEPVRAILVRDAYEASMRQAGASGAVLALWTPREPVAGGSAAGRVRNLALDQPVPVGPPARPGPGWK